MDPLKSTTTDSEAKSYLAEKEIPQLFESMLTGLMYSRPDDPLGYLEECINKSKEAGVENIMWDTFALKKDPLPPITPTPREKSFITQQEPDDSRHRHTEQSAASNNAALNPYQALPPIGGTQTSHQGSEQQEVEESTIGATSGASNLLGILPGTIPTQMKQANDPKFCIFIGSIGSGKESHFSQLEHDLGMMTIKVEDLVEKEAAKEDSELGEKIKEYVNLGAEIPNGISLELIKAEVNREGARNGYIIDGLPVAEFESQIGEISWAFYFEESEDELHNSIEKTEDVAEFLTISASLATYFDQLDKLVRIPSTSSRTEQMEMIKSALAEIGVTAAGGGTSQEVQEDDIVAEQDTGVTGLTDNSIPPSSLVGTSFVSLLGSDTADTSQVVSYLQEKHGFSLLRMSDILSEEAFSESDLGLALKTTMLQGREIPHDMSLAVILGAVIKNASSEKIILEGFPRSEEQLDLFEKTVGGLSFAIYLEETEEQMIEVFKSTTLMKDSDIEEEIANFKTHTLPVVQMLQNRSSLCKIPAQEFSEDNENLKSSLSSLKPSMLSQSSIESVQSQLIASSTAEDEIPASADMKSVFEKLPIVFVTGGPGSGKGTQCDKIVKEFNFTHLSSGDLLRAKVASGSPDGQELEAVMKAGKLVPLEKVLDLITEAMIEAVAQGSCNGFLIDGYPREIDQGLKFEQQIKPCSLVIDFDVPDEIMVQRLIKRGETSGRQDDNEETIRARLTTYREATVPVATHYGKQGKLVSIDANRSVDEVFADVAKAFNSRLQITSQSAKEQLNKLPIVFVSGGPGSGKGTQCDKIVKEFNFTHLSSGDLLRAKVASGSPDGRELEAVMKAGKLFPLEKVLDLITEAMTDAVTQGPCSGFLIDGYPREIEQGLKFEEKIKPCSLVIDFDVPDEIMVQRLIKRGETSGRQDDNEETIRARLTTYREATVPVATHYNKQGKLVSIDANRSVDEVFADVTAAFSKLLSGESNKMAETLNKLPIVFVTGGPGSGKGTQCDKIVKEFNFTHLSSGDLLRAKVASGSPDGQELEAVMKAGKLVPLEKVLDLITEAMTNAVSAGPCNGFLIDGYPREIEQGLKFEEKIKPCSLVIDFDVPDEIMVQRLIKRGETSGRQDDNEETIRARLTTYREATVPVATHYGKQGKLVSIDANRSVEEVFQDVIKAFATIGMAPSGITQPVFFIVGGPGSGKGTQCEKIVAEFSFTHLSSGDLLRAEVASGSEKGKALDAAMKAGQLVTTETVLDLMKSAMLKEKEASKGYLIDGYPRKVDQGELFEKIVAPCAACIFFDVPNEVMKERLLKRAETSGRADDNEETITKRLVTFDNETKPVLTYYEGKGKLHKIDAQRTVDEIYADVRTVLLPYVK